MLEATFKTFAITGSITTVWMSVK